MTGASPSAAAAMPATLLDRRIEAATGLGIEVLRRHRGERLLDEPTSRLVDAHQELVGAERDIGFWRTRLHRLTSGETAVDQALLGRIDRTFVKLREAAGSRDACAAAVLAVLEPLEQAARSRAPADVPDLSAPDFAALLAIAQGAVLREHLLTQRLTVVTASGTRVTWTAYQRLEEQGLVTRDQSHPLHAGQPVTLTDTGRTCLTASRSTSAPTAAGAATWPTGARRHR